MAWKNTIITRDELYQAVWEEPVLQVARRYGISNVALSKICRKLNVPIPGRGFWARVAAGEVPSPTALPPARPDARHWYELRQWVSPVEDEDFGDDARALLEFEDSDAARVDPPEEHTKTHPMVEKYGKILRRNQKKLGDTFFLENQCLDIRAQGDALERAVRVMNAILFALARRSFEVVVTAPSTTVLDRWGHSTPKPSVTGANILDSFVTFRIQEQFDSVRIENKPSDLTWRGATSSRTRPEYARRPNGQLSLKITNHNITARRATWSDGQVARIEKCIEPFLRELIAVAASSRAELRVAERERAARRLEAERRAQEEREREIQVALRNDLNCRIDNWKRAEEIRLFALVVEAAACRYGDCVGDADLSRWLSWARAEAERVENTAVRFSLEEIQLPDT